MRGTDPRSARRVRRSAAIAAAAAIGLLATACGGPASSGLLPGQAKAQAAASAKARAAALAADLKITPSNGSHGVDPSAGISVTAAGGQGDQRHRADLG